MKKLSFNSGLVIGVIIGLVLGVLMGVHVSNQIRNALITKSQNTAPKIAVICAMRDMPAGTVISKSDLAKIFVFETTLPANHFVSPEDAPQIIGRKLLFNINRGNPILWPDLEQIPNTGIEDKENRLKPEGDGLQPAT